MKILVTLDFGVENRLRPLSLRSEIYLRRYSVLRHLTLNLTLKVKVHNLENSCDAGFWGEESIATTFIAI